ncbi:DUF429 domain-containing protein [Gloeobacter kilaueensis]|uniref:DUF429 domain-containing protein n=1 Tax=Gloeobacter kilaueensis (strain ATCC BAA-2537 / CCAP 1431/1 / ULC 316 / JS1) TaxID=1183438 RepID=U5QHV5_GLOK1|nr:DUF429 domain-containing protein [Gloeobacter kilaueensis]AGY57245.1 hypothetical protein GKIL_0999 [Gloeobacter kilaueensis JS1]
MYCLGIDFGWQSQPSGLAALHFTGDKTLQLACPLECRSEPSDILGWVEAVVGEADAIVAVDAPTLIPNATGMRVPDREAHRLFGKYHAGCYPANLGRPYAQRTLDLGLQLEAHGFVHADRLTPRQPGRYQIEVFPHPAIVELFGLDRIIKYKKGPLADRIRELGRYRELMLTVLPHLAPPVVNLELPPVPASGTALKALEDRLDGLLCAYVAAHWWYWGLERNRVLGSRSDGYIVVPQLHNLESPRSVKLPQ